MESPTLEAVSVSWLNSHIKNLIDGSPELRNILLTAEISDFKNHTRSGHFYLTLKDEKSSLRAVMFSSYARRLDFEPENGMQILAVGNISVYEKSGQYQFYIEYMKQTGEGFYGLEFERLKRKLEEEGLFSDKFKKEIPAYPERIGLVTSDTGAALSDVINVLSRRWPSATVILFPAGVQGENAPAQLAEAIRQADARSGADVILLVRGGGSVEDLRAFNDERVARAIFECKTPLVSGIGHETDFTIADFTADLRASTPTAAAERSVPDRAFEKQKLDALRERAKKAVLDDLRMRREKLDRLRSSRSLSEPLTFINEKRLFSDSLLTRLDSRMKELLKTKRTGLALLASNLDTLSPLKQLSRGYSLVLKEQKILNSVKAVQEGDALSLRLSDGSIACRAGKIAYGPYRHTDHIGGKEK